MNFIPDFANAWRALWNRDSFFNSRPTFYLGQSGVVWIDTEKPGQLYDEIPELSTPINKLAAMFSNAVIRVENDKGEDIGTDEFYKLMERPNLMESMNQWLSSFYIQKWVYGNTFMYKNQPSPLLKLPFALWNISPAYARPILTGKTFDQLELKGIISGYEYIENGVRKVYDPEYILYTRISDKDNPFIGKSPLTKLKFPLTNTKLAYEYRNVMLGKRGAHGAVSPEAVKDMTGAVPFLPKNKEDLEREYHNKRGINEGQVPFMVADFPLKFTHFSVPIKDAMVFEEVSADSLTIIDALGMNRNMVKDSTYENQKSGYIQTYDDTIQPQADLFGQDQTSFLGKGIAKDGKGKASIKLKYDHLLILQQDKGKEADTFKKQIDAVVQLYEKRMTNKENAVKMLVSLSGINMEKPDKEDAIDKLNRVSALVANNIVQQGVINEIRALIDWGKLPGEDGNERPVAANAQFNINSFPPAGA